MPLKPFDEHSATVALAQASALLRAAGVESMWLDVPLSGWIKQFVLTVKAATTTATLVAAKPLDGQRRYLMERPTLAQPTRNAVCAALADLGLRERDHLVFRPLTSARGRGTLIWPTAPVRQQLDQLDVLNG